MNRFAELLDALSFEPRRNGKLRLLSAYFRETPDPERGYALAAMTGTLRFAHAKPGLVRALIAERTDPVLFALSYDYVGDLSETAALLWPATEVSPNEPAPPLSEVIATLAQAPKRTLPQHLANWLDRLDETGRWALLKLITGSLRIGVSARLAKTAVAMLGERETDEVEEVWHGLTPPFESLFAWVEGRGERPRSLDPAPFRPPMLAHPLDEADFASLDPAEFAAEWKWDGIRVQVAGGTDDTGRSILRLYSRTGEEITGAFPDVAEALHGFDGALDGELLVVREAQVQSFQTLQQRLNRKAVSPKLLQEYPAHVRAYDIIALAGEDLRALPFRERRALLERTLQDTPRERLSLSPLVPFSTWEELASARADPDGIGADALAIEGCMLKRADSPYVPGRPKGLWFKWKRDPYNVDAVLMYAQRGHGKRSSFYSDFTFGVWRGEASDAELVPVGKAYFGFTDEELISLDRFVRQKTINRFGPVREVVHEPDAGLVLEIAFEGLQRSTRHKSGVAMRFPRIARIRWDKPPREADRIETLEALLKDA